MSLLDAAGDSLILFETFEITGQIADFRASVTAFCRKVEADGVAGVFAMQFYASAETKEAYLFLTFKDEDAFDKHVAFIMNTDEVKPYLNAVRLRRIQIFGAIKAESAKRQQELAAQRGWDFQWVADHVVGFLRSGAAGLPR